MAVLADADRAAVWSQWMHLNREDCSITKADLRAAVDALDVFLDNNAAAINSAIPQPARGALTAAQKARLLSLVALRRFGG
jgi:hypothetical protein